MSTKSVVIKLDFKHYFLQIQPDPEKVKTTNISEKGLVESVLKKHCFTFLMTESKSAFGQYKKPDDLPTHNYNYP